MRDIEDTLRHAVLAFKAASEAERESKLAAATRLATRLFLARRRALKARLKALQEHKGGRTDLNLANIQKRESDLHGGGVEAILREFHLTPEP